MTESNSTMPRIIIVAEHASDKFGGEAILPLHYFRFLRKRGAEVWLVVHERTRAELNEAIDKHDQSRIHYIPDTVIHRGLWRVGSFLPHRIASIVTGIPMHLFTQWLQRRIVRKLVKSNRVDIVHEPMPVSPKQPSLMFAVGVPVIIGPMNGGMKFPPAFSEMESRAEQGIMFVGRFFSSIANRLIPGKRHASLLLVANERTRQALPKKINPRVQQLVENGVDLSVWKDINLTHVEEKANAGQVRFVFMGRLVDWKAIDILFDALAVLNSKGTDPKVFLDILGDGEERSNLEMQASELNISHIVKFHGFMQQRDCAAFLSKCDALVLPSLYECGGAVVLEAMAMSKPVIATDWGGPADYLDESCGILVPPDSREALVNGFADAMQKLANSKDLREQLGNSGREKILQEFDWQRKIDQILEIYNSILCTTKMPHTSQRTRL